MLSEGNEAVRRSIEADYAWLIGERVFAPIAQLAVQSDPGSAWQRRRRRAYLAVGLCRVLSSNALTQIAPQKLATDDMQVGVRLALHSIVSEV